MLQECECGEPLVDNAPSWPLCHRPNPAYRPSRWRVFWPDTDTLAGAADAIQLGYWAAFAVAVITAAGALIGVLGTTAAPREARQVAPRAHSRTERFAADPEVLGRPVGISAGMILAWWREGLGRSERPNDALQLTSGAARTGAARS